jgi:A/G-specific adenine glycosylase
VTTSASNATSECNASNWSNASRAESVLQWALQNGRDLPWRDTRDPWAVLVSEIMAQQTQVDRVVPKWTAFLQLWPTPQDCAAASLGDVLRIWQGLGYPRRAKNLHGAAITITEAIEAGGSFPNTLDGLLSLPGVGPYTARAVMAFAFEADVAVVDTNTARLMARWNNRQLDRKAVQQAADDAVPPGEGWAWNQAMLDLGATICTLRNPRCRQCPVRDMCAYQIYRQGDGSDIDPAVGTAGVSVPQSTFVGSNRQIRGRILKAAAAMAIPIDEVGHTVGIAEDAERVNKLVRSLLEEGLLELANGLLRLPQ